MTFGLMRPIKFVLNDDYGIYVEERGPNSWAVTYGGMCMDVTGRWDYESMPSTRTDEYKATHRFASPDAACAAFLEFKHKLTINGRTL